MIKYDYDDSKIETCCQNMLMAITKGHFEFGAILMPRIEIYMGKMKEHLMIEYCPFCGEKVVVERDSFA